MYRFHTIAIAASALLLGACDTASEGSRGPSFDDLGTEINGLFGVVDFGNDAAKFSPAALPSSGSAQYNGVVSVNLLPASTVSGNGLLIRGDMTLDANFASDTFTGSAGSFSDSDADTYSGSLAITNGTIDNTANTASEVTFIGDIGGTLASDNTASTYDVDAFVAGDFYGPNFEYVGGVIRGDLTTPTGTLLIWDNNDQGVPDGDGVFLGSQ